MVKESKYLLESKCFFKNCKSFIENTMKLVKSLKDGETKIPPLKAMNKHKEDSF